MPSLLLATCLVIILGLALAELYFRLCHISVISILCKDLSFCLLGGILTMVVDDLFWWRSWLFMVVLFGGVSFTRKWLQSEVLEKQLLVHLKTYFFVDFFAQTELWGILICSDVKSGSGTKGKGEKYRNYLIFWKQLVINRILQCLNAKILGSDPYLYHSYKALQNKIERSTSID